MNFLGNLSASQLILELAQLMSHGFSSAIRPSMTHKQEIVEVPVRNLRKNFKNKQPIEKYLDETVQIEKQAALS